MHPADQWWQRSVIASFENGWLASSVYRNRNSRRWISLRTFYSRWRRGQIICNLPELVIFAPSESVAGFVEVRSLNNSILLFLSSQVEFDSQADCDFTVAHEISHIALGHYLLPADERGFVEIEADAQAEQWGFPKRKRGKRLFSQLVERPLKSSR